MFDTSKLRGRIVEVFGSQNEFAAAAGCSVSFLSQYLNGKKILDQKTIEKWCEALRIESQEIPAYFFTKRVHEVEQ